MASIRKRGNSYRVEIRLSGLKPISKSFPTKKLAQEYARKVEGDTKLQKALGGNSELLSSLIDQFIEQYTNKDKSLPQRLLYWKEELGHYPILQITPDMIRERKRQLIKSNKANGTINRYKSALSAVFNWAEITPNPCHEVRTETESKGRKRVFTEAERTSFLKAAKGAEWDKFYLFCLMAFTTGARRGELERLKWTDIDYKNKQAMLRDTKNGDDRIIHLTSLVVEELSRVWKSRTDGNVIPIGIERVFGRYDFRSDWKSTIRVAGIRQFDDNGEHLVFHSIRHSFCTDLHRNGQDLKVIQSLAGHKSIQTTLRYTHDDEGVRKSVINDVFANLS